MTADVLLGVGVSLAIVAAAGLLVFLFGALARPLVRRLLAPPRSRWTAATATIPRAAARRRRPG